MENTNLVLGTMNIEYKYSSLSDKSIKNYQDIIQTYISSTDNPILDTAYYYGNTKTEKVLGDIIHNLSKIPKIATKANPWYDNDFTTGILGQLSKRNLENQLTVSLENLKLDKVDIFYLHCPDYKTPINETLEKCDELWRKEKFDYLGISNFSKDQLKEVIEICDNEKYNQPVYYQGMYNLISRKVEEIFPILDDNHIEFWGYNPLAGGLLTGKYKNKDLSNNSRFKDNNIYQNIFWKDKILSNCDEMFNYLLDAQQGDAQQGDAQQGDAQQSDAQQSDAQQSDAQQSDGVHPHMVEYSLQWLIKYSKLRQNDKIILGVSTKEQLETNLTIINTDVNYNKNIVDYLNKIYFKIEDVSPSYYY